MTKRILLVLAVVLALGAAMAPGAARAQDEANLEKTELMLHGLIAIHASVVIDMDAYRAGLLSKKDAQAEIARNNKFLEVLQKSATALKNEAAVDGPGDTMSFAQDFLHICTYVKLALDSFKTYVAEGEDVDRDLFDRYIAKVEEAVERLLAGNSKDE